VAIAAPVPVRAGDAAAAGGVVLCAHAAVTVTAARVTISLFVIPVGLGWCGAMDGCVFTAVPARSFTRMIIAPAWHGSAAEFEMVRLSA
jgi:hypothetical protein